ncbi:hypothetical protein [Denitrobaculum tricleocarpae]|uniref:Uncharacterized protein n=1 Tax=Denitrobaculum tricleocarpae TaxID=2591009 RepID=A0A545U0T4_9PROT|nr:hypothetical protein [Denitrobaculum tricleocarpae]TQV83090.1 hypothetical protein FKG95_00345 [Denitrobaculum tricleocarpae]
MTFGVAQLIIFSSEQVGQRAVLWMIVSRRKQIPPLEFAVNRERIAATSTMVASRSLRAHPTKVLVLKDSKLRAFPLGQTG